MRPKHVRLSLTVALAAAGACGDEDTVHCTQELRSALTVYVRDTAGRLIEADSVTARVQGDPLKCDPMMSQGYVCWEQGGGTYVVRVAIGHREQTQSTTIAADECHTTESKTLEFVF